MNSSFKNRDIIAIQEFKKPDILRVIDQTHALKQTPQPDLLKGSILGCCFFEPSTRTRLTFESAMHRLGGTVIGFSDMQATSAKKGECLQDTMRMLENYADLIVLRHPLEGAAQLAADTVSIPVINAGDGANQHPTQTLLDLYTIRSCQGTLDNLRVALVGDLKYGRTVHSLVQALVHFNVRLYLIYPPSLELPKENCDELREKGIKFSFHHSIEEVMDKIDILYMTRIQEERFSHKLEYEKVKNSFILKVEHLEKAKQHLKILHPLPRVNEIERAVDDTPHAHYFEQAKNGLYLRQALMGMILGKIE